jgi:hypothetical protein
VGRTESIVSNIISCGTRPSGEGGVRSSSSRTSLPIRQIAQSAASRAPGWIWAVHVDLFNSHDQFMLNVEFLKGVNARIGAGRYCFLV